ncbi:MAG TPA: hypothetical protein VGG68_00940 [Caulobacteraceae bacterium]
MSAKLTAEQTAILRAALSGLIETSREIMSLRYTDDPCDPDLALQLGMIAGRASKLSDDLAALLPPEARAEVRR